MPHFATYDILVSPKYRPLRYLCLCLAYLIFSYSEASYHYAHASAVPFASIVLVAFLSKTVASVFLLVLLVPLLLKRRYTSFLLLTLAITFTAVWLQQIVLEKMICRHFDLHYWRDNTDFLHTLIDIFSQNALWLMVISGVLMGRLLKYWSWEAEEKQQMETSQLQMESEFMKEQVSPSLLCGTLHRSGEAAQSAPKETSDMLMQLSRMLRYQLYDCRHEKVLLESEIKFLNEYLSILRYNEGCTDFSISVTGQTMGILIPPLLFVPFLQSEDDADTSSQLIGNRTNLTASTSARPADNHVNSNPDANAPTSTNARLTDNHASGNPDANDNPAARRADIHIRFIIQDGLLTFDLKDDRTHRNDRNVRRRLERLYPQKHELTVEPEHLTLKIQI